METYILTGIKMTHKNDHDTLITPFLSWTIGNTWLAAFSLHTKAVILQCLALPARLRRLGWFGSDAHDVTVVALYEEYRSVVTYGY